MKENNKVMRNFYIFFFLVFTIIFLLLTKEMSQDTQEFFLPFYQKYAIPPEVQLILKFVIPVCIYILISSVFFIWFRLFFIFYIQKNSSEEYTENDLYKKWIQATGEVFKEVIQNPEASAKKATKNTMWFGKLVIIAVVGLIVMLIWMGIFMELTNWTIQLVNENPIIGAFLMFIAFIAYQIFISKVKNTEKKNLKSNF